MNFDLQQIYEHSYILDLKLNPLKSSFLLFGKQKSCNLIKNQIKIQINNSNIPYVTEAKNLGVTINNSFRYRTHINKHRSTLNKEIKTILCNAYVLSEYTYSTPIYHVAIDKLTGERI